MSTSAPASTQTLRLAISATPLPSSTPTAPTSPTPRATATPRQRPSSTPTWIEAVSQERLVAPILLYHHIGEPSTADRTYTTSPGQFRAQLDILKTEGFHPITTSELVSALRGEGSLPERPVLIVFDDGYQDVFQNAYPILREYGYPATLNLITRMVGHAPYMDAEAASALIAEGWEIGSHGLNHYDLTRAGDPIGEICRSKRDLEKLLESEINTFAYPFGAANPYVTQIVKDCGYTSAGGVGPLHSHTAKTIYFLSRIPIDGNWSLEQFKTALHGQLEIN